MPSVKWLDVSWRFLTPVDYKSYKINRIYNMHSPVHFEYLEICYPEEISKVPKVPDNQGLTD